MRGVCALLCLVCCSCSLLGLSDEIHQNSCQDDVDCEVLNDRTARDFDPCQIWQCDDRTKLCVFEPTDFDHDGVPPPFCGDVGTRGDCNDRDPSINPRAGEVCDGADNDCDQSVDEGMLEVSHDTGLEFDDDVRELDYAWNPMSLEVGVIYRHATDERIGFNVLGGSRTTRAEPLVFSSDGEALRGSNVAATVRVGHFLGGVAEAGTPQRLWVGDVATGAGRSLLRLGPGMREQGLRCAADEVCATGFPVSPSTRMRLSVLGERVLAAYTRRMESAACGSVPSRPILINLLTETSAGAQETSEVATVLDQTSDGLSPTLLPILHGIEPYGWLAAYPNANGDLIVQRVSMQLDGSLASQRMLRLPRGEQPISHVQLALGGEEQDQFMIGIAAQIGCGKDARVLFGLLQLTWDATGRGILRVYREPRVVSDEPAEQPALGFNVAYSDWGILYMNDDGLFARVLDRNGLSVGGEAYRISEGRPSVADYAIARGSDGNLFGVYSYRERTLDVATLHACGPPL